MRATSQQPPTEIFKALSDPIRWDIVLQMASVDELACVTLEDTLPVSKPTISYHTKILQQAGLLSVRKEGRNYFYRLRHEVLREAQDELWRLGPAPRPVGDGRIDYGAPPAMRRAERPMTAQPRSRRDEPSRRRAAGDEEAVVLTW